MKKLSIRQFKISYFKIYPLVALSFITATQGFAAGGPRPEEVRLNQTVLEQRAELDRLHAERLRIEADHARSAAEIAAARTANIRAEENQRRAIARTGAISRSIDNQAARMSWTMARCAENADGAIGSVAEAAGRASWAARCLDERANNPSTSEDERAFLRVLIPLNHAQGGRETVPAQNGSAARGLYPTFGRISFVEDPTNPENVTLNVTTAPHDPWPTDPSASCTSLNGFTLVGFCTSGCFTRDQTVLFPGGFVEIARAHEAHFSSAVTLSSQSSLGHLSYSTTGIDYYTVSDVDQWQEIVELQTTGNHHLKVTTNHPMLLANGNMVRADQLQNGMSLLNEAGEPEVLVNVSRSNYFGKVYNLRMRSPNLQENIVVAQGLLTGTSFYQNEGQEYLNRLVLRSLIPQNLITSQE